MCNTGMKVQTLSEKQTAWIYGQIRILTDKYMKLVPFNQATWNCFIRDVNNLAEKAHQDCLFQKLSLGLIAYFEELHKDKHHVFVKEGETIESTV